jgi:hypothetical protein
MDTANISFDINTTDAEALLGVEVWIDDTCVYQNPHVKELHQFSHTMDDKDGDHELRVVMSGKTAEHTKIDGQGNIIKDALISITNVRIDEIDVAPLFHSQVEYHHDFNGTQEPVQDTFHKHMGCNGTLSLKFSTPIYLWLLENM